LAELMAWAGAEFPLQGRACGGDIRFGGDGRQEPAPFEPEVRKWAMGTMALPAWNGTAAGVARSWAAHRLGRTRADPRRLRHLAGTDRRTARNRRPQPL